MTGEIVNDSVSFFKIVEWSDADGAFVGQCPGIVGPCCHGADETAVYRELCDIVEDWIAIFESDGRPLPHPTFGEPGASATGV